MNKIVSRGEHAPKEVYEVYDAVDQNHKILIYAGESREDAIAKAKAYAKEFDIPLKCMEVYQLTKQERA